MEPTLNQGTADDVKLGKLLSDTQSVGIADPYMLDGLASLLLHINSTYSDKYEEGQPLVDNTWLKYGPGIIPAGHNIGQSVNYLKRYLSSGFDKSYKVDDLKKAAHFILMEIARRENEV